MAVADWNREWMCKSPHPKMAAPDNVAAGVSPKSKMVKAPAHEPKMAFHTAATVMEMEVEDEDED